MAQDVEQVLPNWADQNSEGYKCITERGSTALLIEALRDLRAEKDAQVAQVRQLTDAKNAEIAELKVRLERLETLVNGKSEAFSVTRPGPACGRRNSYRSDGLR